MIINHLRFEVEWWNPSDLRRYVSIATASVISPKLADEFRDAIARMAPEEYRSRQAEAEEAVNQLVRRIAPAQRWEEMQREILATPPEVQLFFYERWHLFKAWALSQTEPILAPYTVEDFWLQALLVRWMEFRSPDRG